MSEARGVDVSIMGREFRIACTAEEEESLMAAVAYLDKKMRDINESRKVVGVERIAIMAALNIAHEFLSARNGDLDIGSCRRRIGAMQAQIERALEDQPALF